MRARGEHAVPRRARRGPHSTHGERTSATRPCAAFLLAALLVAFAVTASGCGAGGETGAYAGEWLRVVAGEPDPAHTLSVEPAGDGADLTFADASGFKAQGVATLEDGRLVMEMPEANGIFDGATSLQVSLDTGGQLVVDRVLEDGTTEPVWIYERAPAAPAEP